MDIARRPASLRIPTPAPAPENLNLKVPTRQRSRRRDYTKFISLGCVVVGLGLVAWFFIQAGMFEEAAVPVRSSKSASGAQISSKESLMLAPVFTGFDKNSQPYSVSAKSARRDEAKPDVVFLNEVKGELKLRKSGDVVVITADRGTYSSDAKKLDLKGTVRMISTGKYSAKTDSAKVNMPNKSLRSETPVNVVFSSGIIDANGVELWDAGERILFFNGVRLHIPKQDKKGSQ